MPLTIPFWVTVLTWPKVVPHIFYDYVKAKQVLRQNEHIDTLVVGYSYGDLDGKMDAWFSGEDKLKFKIRNHMFLFSLEDYLGLLKSNPISVSVNTPQTILHNIKMSRIGYSHLGGYLYLEREKLAEAKLRAQKEARPTGDNISEYQARYLQKLYALCQEKDVVMVLLNTPVHPMKIEAQQALISNYCAFARQNLPKAVLVNHAGYKVPENCYADLAHLNFKGARIYSEFLKNTPWTSYTEACDTQKSNENNQTY